MKWNFKWVSDLGHIQSSEFLSWWYKILNESINKTIFCHPLFVLTWIIENNGKPFFSIAQSDDITVFFPLMLSKLGILKRLESPGRYEYDYFEPLFYGNCDKQTIGSYWEAFESEIDCQKKYWDILRIRGIRQDFALIRDNWQKEDSCPGFSLSGYSNIAEYLLTRSSSFRGDTYRQIRRLNCLGELDFHIYSVKYPDLDSSINEFLFQREEKWEHSKIYRKLFKTIIFKAIEEGIGQLSVLRLDDTPISWNFSLIYKNTFHYWFPLVSNTKYLNYSPGKVHLYFLVDNAIKMNLVYFDLMRGDEEYKKNWSDAQTETYFYNKTAQKIKTKLKMMILKII